MKRLLILLFAAASLRAEELVYDLNIPGVEEIIGTAQETGPNSVQFSSYFRAYGSFSNCDSSFSFSCIDEFGVYAGEPGDYPTEAEFNVCPIGCDPGYDPYSYYFPSILDMTTPGTYDASASPATLTISVAPEPRSWALLLAGLTVLAFGIRYGAASKYRVRRQPG